MSDILGSFLGASSGLTNSSGATTTDLLVNAYKQTRKAEVDAATKRKTDLQAKQTFYNNLRTKLTNLSNQIDTFTASDASSKFVTRAATSSDATVVAITVDSTAESGINSIKVNRLATNDILISKQLAISASDKFSVSGEKTFKINGKSVTVNIAADSTNEQAIKAIASAINKVADINVTGSFVKDTETTGRLTLTSKSTGSGNNISFSDDSSGVLNALGFDNVDPNASDRTQVVSNSSLAYYKSSSLSGLNSLAEINGINISRSSNTISDVLPGATLNLLKPQAATDQAVTLSTDINVTSVESVINPLITAYNESIKFLKLNSSIIRNDTAVSSLYNNLRSVSSQAVTSAGDNNPKFLSDIGIKINTDGTLILSDKTKLTDLLKDDPAKVSKLFIGSDGFANKMLNSISNLVGDQGQIKSKTYSLGTQIDTASKRIQTLQTSIDKQAENLKKQYQSVYSLYISATQQFTYLTSTSTSTTG